ncbi:MAG: hypothetical protein AAF824_25185 [Bacteroidota bacterium]
MVHHTNQTCLPDYHYILCLLLSFLMFLPEGKPSPLSEAHLAGLSVRDSAGHFKQMHRMAKSQGKYLAIFFYDVMSTKSREAEKMLYAKYQYDQQFSTSVLLMRQNGFAVSGEAKQLKEAFYIKRLPTLLILDEERRVVEKIEGSFGEEIVNKLFHEEVEKDNLPFSWQKEKVSEVSTNAYRAAGTSTRASTSSTYMPSFTYFPTEAYVLQPEKEGYNAPQYGLVIRSGLSWEQCVQRTGAWLLLWPSIIWARYDENDTYSLVLGGSEKKREIKKFKRYLAEHGISSTVSLFSPDIYHYRRLF